jgi:hypothetical protein
MKQYLKIGGFSVFGGGWRWFLRFFCLIFWHLLASSVESKFAEENVSSLFVSEVNYTLNIQVTSYSETLVFFCRMHDIKKEHHNLYVRRFQFDIQRTVHRDVFL